MKKKLLVFQGISQREKYISKEDLKPLIELKDYDPDVIYARTEKIMDSNNGLFAKTFSKADRVSDILDVYSPFKRGIQKELRQYCGKFLEKQTVLQPIPDVLCHSLGTILFGTADTDKPIIVGNVYFLGSPLSLDFTWLRKIFVSRQWDKHVMPKLRITGNIYYGWSKEDVVCNFYKKKTEKRLRKLTNAKIYDFENKAGHEESYYIDRLVRTLRPHTV